MTDDSRPISLEVQAEGGGTASSAEAASMGLIVTELVMLAAKTLAFGYKHLGRSVVVECHARSHCPIEFTFLDDSDHVARQHF